MLKQFQQYLKYRFYIISIAFTKNVVTNGNINVSQGQWVAIAKTNAATEMKNNIHIKPLFLVAEDIIILFSAKIMLTY